MDEYEQLCLWEDYKPKVNDYVIWDKGEYGIEEGWVYFYDDEYITIETGVKPKPNCMYSSGKPMKHKMIHTLLLCYEQDWWQLKYVRSRTPVEQIQHYSQCDD